MSLNLLKKIPGNNTIAHAHTHTHTDTGKDVSYVDSNVLIHVLWHFKNIYF